MSRGGGWLTGGILLVIGSYCGGAMLRSAAISAVKNSRGFDETAQQMNTLGCFGSILNLALLGGIIAVIVGIVVLVVDSGKQDAPPYSPPPPPYVPPPPPPRPTATEEEIRRLREEVEQLKRDRVGGSKGTTPGTSGSADPGTAADGGA
ncbi:MAG TPA: hypothetical protein VD866_31585 [Urbifossiella sp.]|nr:hypothetical protein [Urbifossiella sp.]